VHARSLRGHGVGRGSLGRGLSGKLSNSDLKYSTYGAFWALFLVQFAGLNEKSAQKRHLNAIYATWSG